MKRALIVLECQQKSIKKSAAAKAWSKGKARSQHILSESDSEDTVLIDTGDDEFGDDDDNDDDDSECVFCGGLFYKEGMGALTQSGFAWSSENANFVYHI